MLLPLFTIFFLFFFKYTRVGFRKADQSELSDLWYPGKAEKLFFRGLCEIHLATVPTLFLPTCLLFLDPAPNLPLMANLPVEDLIDCSRNNNHASAFIRIKIYKFCSLIMYSIVRWHQKPVTWNRKAQRKTKVCSPGRSVLTVSFFFLSRFVFLMLPNITCSELVSESAFCSIPESRWTSLLTQLPTFKLHTHVYIF